MVKTYKEVLAVVRQKLGAQALKDLERAASQPGVTLWGARKGRGFVKRCVVLALYKDLTGQGYDELYKETKAWGLASTNTLRHNIKQVRLAGSVWGRKKLKLGDANGWNMAARELDLMEPV